MKTRKQLEAMKPADLATEVLRLQRIIDQDDKAAEIQRLKGEVNKLTAVNARQMALEGRKLELERELAAIAAELT